MIPYGRRLQMYQWKSSSTTKGLNIHNLYNHPRRATFDSARHCSTPPQIRSKGIQFLVNPNVRFNTNASKAMDEGWRRMTKSADSGMSGVRHASVNVTVSNRGSPSPHRVYIALGSNVGDGVKNIEMACKEMDDEAIFVKRTSFLYETKPMYLENQPLFINGVCEVSNAQHVY